MLVCEDEKTLAALQRQFVEAPDASNMADFLRISPWETDAGRAALRQHQVSLSDFRVQSFEAVDRYCVRLSSAHYGLPFCAVKAIFANVEDFTFWNSMLLYVSFYRLLSFYTKTNLDNPEGYLLRNLVVFRKFLFPSVQNRRWKLG